MKLAEIFINEDGRLRSGWRFVIFLLAFIFLLGVLSGSIGAIFLYFPLEFLQSPAVGINVQNVIFCATSIVVGWLCGKYLEHLPFRAIGVWFTRNWLKDLLIGLLIGTLTIGFSALLLIVFGATTFQINQTAGQSAILHTLFISLIIFVIGAAMEESLFRGYILQTFLRANLAWFAILMTSLFFASAHLKNPSVNNIGLLNTILAGVWFSAAYLKTRTLWLACGLHFAWNWIQGAILGISVSGQAWITPAPLLQPTNTGSIILTGGDYGIEGGIATSLAILLSMVLIWFLPILKPTEEMLELTGGKQFSPDPETIAD